VTIVRIGATKKYTQNWGQAFSQKPTARTAKGAQKPKAAGPKNAAKKPAAKGKSK
jgi:hypothetical protein